MVRRTVAARRAGFSLIELLIVIAIIVILMSLLLVGLRAARQSGERLQATHEISQLATGCADFKRDFGVYPPHLMYDSTGTAQQYRPPTSPSDPGFSVLQTMFPRWAATEKAKSPAPTYTFNGWAGKSLRSDQCLLFFLAGPFGVGWNSIDPNATLTSASAPKKGPYLDLTSLRVTNAGNYGSRILDPWADDLVQSSYIYFASKGGGDYDTTAATVASSPDNAVPPKFATFPATPSYAATYNVQPYKQGSLWVNTGSVQIISGGPNRFFGRTGQTWSPGAGDYETTGGGGDDLANFNKGAQLSVNTSN